MFCSTLSPSLHYTYLTCEQALRVTGAGGWVRASPHDLEFKMAPLWASCQKSTNQHLPDCKHWQHVLCRYLVYHCWGRNSGTKICKGKKPSAEIPNNYCRNAIKNTVWKYLEVFFHGNFISPVREERQKNKNHHKKISLSEGLYKPCATKIRRTWEVFSFMPSIIWMWSYILI